MEFVSRKCKDDNYPSIRETIILYNPNSDDVKLIRYPVKTQEGSDDYARYKRKIGACMGDIRNKKLVSNQRKLFGDVMAMIIRDNVDPKAVHNAMLGLREYRKLMAFDMPNYDGWKYEDINIMD